MKRCCTSIYHYLGAGLALAIVAIVLVAGFAASRQNELSVNAQKVIAGHDAEEAFDRVHITLLQMSFWQEAYEKTGAHWNQKWVDYQFGPYLDFYGVHLVALFGADGQLRFLYASGASAGVTGKTLAKANGLTTLLGAVEATPLRQPPTLREGMVIVGGVPYFASAGIITPENATDFPLNPDQRVTAVFFRPAAAADFEALTEGYGAQHVTISLHDDAPKGFDAVALNDAAGKPLAWLQWQPVLPGANFLWAILPSLLIVFVLLALLQFFLLRRWQTLQRALYMADAKALAAEEESRAKSVFLGTISHELRTPLNAIIGFADVLRCRLFGPLGSPRYEEYAGYIQASGHTLLKIVNDLIEIARIDAHDTALECEAVDAARCALAAIDSAKEAALAKHVSLVVEGDTHDAWCMGSTLSFQQVLTRLVDYAVRYAYDASVVTVMLTRQNGELAIAVINQCPGIPPGEIEKLGKLFQHTESHLIASDYDTGLGLVVVNGLMRLMGGSLAIESEMGVRTTATLRLPVAEAPARAQKAAA